ncbi:MAG: penicillin-binding protein 2 [Candidatus Cyclobacteriaceae bacterium M3_2C_046]
MNENRKFFIKVFFILIGIVLLLKLFFLQVANQNYADAAERNIIQKVIEYPYRGLIYDRNGKLIVYNKPVYDLQVVPKDVVIKDTLELCNLLNITREELNEKLDQAKDYSYVKPSIFVKQISNDNFARIQDQLIEYSGFQITPRTVRAYPYKSMANALGCIAEISDRELGRDTANYYNMGDYIGKTGVELSYEGPLRGKRGVKYKMVNVKGVEKGSFKNGQLDTISIPGKNLVSTIDIDLQNYVESLLDGKIGGVVAIEPSSGEILAMASAPTYDPNILSGREYGKNYVALTKDTTDPLFIRPIMATYPPGSMFKAVQALIALEEGVITADEMIYCDGGLIGDHAPPGYYNVVKGIMHSSNNYFYKVFRRLINQNVSPNTFVDSRIGLEKWREYLLTFGLGIKPGIDIPNAEEGNIPTVEYYDRVYGRERWKFSTIYSLSIGQGEVSVTPLQMANLACIIGNEGYYYLPHLVKEIGESGEPLPQYMEKHLVPIDTSHFNVVKDAMEMVIQAGTGQYRAKLKDISVCGKTSTVENPHGEDHSGFIAFAPKENPKIAVAAYIENAGQGARAAASIASLTVEKYLLGEIQRPWIEEYALKGEFLH